MFKRKVLGVIFIPGIIMIISALLGCSATIDKDTKVFLKGPKAEVSRTF